MANPISQDPITHRTLDVNGIRLHIAEQGQGPLVILCHGWPELWYSWKRQLPALAAAGYHAVAFDMRGYGESSAPEDVSAYTVLHSVGDVVSLVTALGEQRAVIVGHDWGAPVAYTAAQIRPDMFPAIVGMSVPFRRRGPVRPLEALAGQPNYYWHYFQSPGVAEAEFERDLAGTFRRLAYLPGKPFYIPAGHGFLDVASDPGRLPDWLSAEDVAVYADSFRRTGFRGAFNWWRNLDRNWELSAPWQDVQIRQPVLFIAGEEDGVVKSPMSASHFAKLSETVPGLKRKLLVPGAGHWVNRERPRRGEFSPCAVFA